VLRAPDGKKLASSAYKQPIDDTVAALTREAWQRRRDKREAVIEGVGTTGRVISSASAWAPRSRSTRRSCVVCSCRP
jgi:hypothetical protein